MSLSFASALGSLLSAHYKREAECSMCHSEDPFRAEISKESASNDLYCHFKISAEREVTCGPQIGVLLFTHQEITGSTSYNFHILRYCPTIKHSSPFSSHYFPSIGFENG